MPRKRLFLFTAMLLTAALTIALTFGVRKLLRSFGERDSIAFVERLGGIAEREESSGNAGWAVAFQGSPDLDDGGLGELAGLRPLVSLDVSGTRVSDVGLQQLLGNSPL